MTETLESPNAPAKKASGGLNSMLLADLKSLAGGLGISGIGSMKKADLVSAIKAAQSAKSAAAKADAPKNDAPKSENAGEQGERRERPRRERAPRTNDGENADAPKADAPKTEPSTNDGGEPPQRNERRQNNNQNNNQGQNRQNQGGNQGNQGNQGGNQGNQGNQGGNNFGDGDGEGRNNRNRRRRSRDRDRRGSVGGGGMPRGEIDTEVREDDVLVPAAGILDLNDNYAFVRTSGYLPSPDDVYVSISMVRKMGLRRGDAIVGQVRQPRDGESKAKFNPMVKIDSVNGAEPGKAVGRPEFQKLTPLYANDRLRMETDSTNLIGRVIDIAAPIGKGQRGLIVSPAKAGKTMVMQSIANSITINNPECHLMVVLVDERPEEVTDFERSVKGEVISSTFDRPAGDHTMVAELAIERAKRLVELGHDVVVLLDGITRLGRAYNLAAPASGRILSGGVDSAALYPPKRFFGAARNIEHGGSLTILATALIESGSKMDEVIFEEFKGTGNMEIRLRRDFAEKRIFPAIDAVQSGTRREELLMGKDELAIVWKLRRVLSALDGQQALELLLERLKKTQSNGEFLMQVQNTTPGGSAE